MAMRWFAKGAVLAGVLIAAMSGSPAYADVPSCNLMVTATTSAKGSVGSNVYIQILHKNLGPNPTRTGGVYWDYVAPPGAELLGTSADYLTQYSPGIRFVDYCKWIVPKTHLRCWAQGIWGDLGGAPMVYTPVHLWLKIDGPITGRGSYSVHCVTDYCTDPVAGNNSVPLIINGVGLYKAPKPTHKPSPKPSPSISISPSPSPTTVVAPSSAAPAVDVPSTTPSLPPVVLAVAASQGAPLWVWVVVPIALLVAAGAGVFVLRRARA